MFRIFKSEWPLAAGIVTSAAFLAFGGDWLADLSNPLRFWFVSLWLFAVILIASFAAVRHAEAIAVKLGEPMGTLVLTQAVTGIDVRHRARAPTCCSARCTRCYFSLT